MEETIVSPLHDQGADESEFTITHVVQDHDFAATQHLDGSDFEVTALQPGALDETLRIASVAPVEALAVTRRRPAARPFDRDGRFSLDGAALERIHAAIDDALDGAPLSSVPSVDLARARISQPLIPMPTSSLERAPRRAQTALALSCALTAAAATAIAVLALVS